MARPIRPNEELVNQVRQLVDRTSISIVARQLGFADATIARLAGGLNVTPGTAAIAAVKIRELLEKQAA